jgi:hypothetical protein
MRPTDVVMVMAAEVMVTSKTVEKLTGRWWLFLSSGEASAGMSFFGMSVLRHVLRSVRRRDGGTVGVSIPGKIPKHTTYLVAMT